MAVAFKCLKSLTSDGELSAQGRLHHLHVVVIIFGGKIWSIYDMSGLD